MKKDCEMLQHRFVGGTAPKKLNGFYRGELLKTVPTTLPEHLASLLLHLWQPWKGKQFYHAKAMGDNVVTTIAEKLIHWKISTQDGHALPFQTRFHKGLFDNIDVMTLDYNRPENPPLVRRFIDELVMIDTDMFLGKAYLREKNIYRTVAFFMLHK